MKGPALSFRDRYRALVLCPGSKAKHGAFRVSRAVMCVLLGVSLAFAPLDVKIGNSVRIQRNESYAFAPVAVGGLAALAAEIGISETALMGAVAAAGAAIGIGSYAIYRSPNGVIWPDEGTPGVTMPLGLPRWDDLTPEERQKWVPGYGGAVGEDAAKRDYYGQVTEIWLKQTGLLQDDGNGGLEPTPEPDKNNDPDGHKKWQKGRNILALLGTGAVVGLADVIGYLGNNLVDSLFKPETDNNETSGFGLGMTFNNTLNGISVNTKYGEYGATISDVYRYMGSSDWALCQHGWGTSNGIRYPVITYYAPNDGVLMLYQGSDSYNVRQQYPVTYINYWIKNGLNTNSHYGESGYSPTGTVTGPASSSNNYIYLNPFYSGTYNVDGTTYFGDSLTNLFSPNYGQIQDTPDYIVNNINNYGDLVNGVTNNYVQPNGQELAVQLPEAFTGTDGAPSWNDYVKPYEETEIKTPSETEPYDPTIPDNPPVNPDNPGEDFDYPSNIAEAVEKLGDKTFGNLFPFCLIGDMQNLSDKLTSAAGYEGKRGGVYTMSTRKRDEREGGITDGYFVLPLSDFGIRGIDNMTFDLDAVFGLGNMIRPWWTVLFAFSLIAESIRYFLK